MLRVHGVALGLGHLGAVLEHHALAEQPFERLVGLHQAGVAQQLVEEARVQQVQDGVLDAAHVLVHRQPVIGAGRIQHRLVLVRAGEAGVVPARFHKGVEGVGFAERGLALVFGFGPLRVGLDRRGDAVHAHVLGQHHRQLVFRHRHLGAVLQRAHRDRRAPVALPGHAPVAQAVVHFLLAQAALGQPGGDGVERLLGGQAVEFTAVHQLALGGEGFVVQVQGLAVGGLDHLIDRQAVLVGELEVALVVGGHRHHRAGAVAHQHEVGHPHRHVLAGDRVPGIHAGEDAFLLHGGDVRLGHAGVLAFVHEGRHFRVALGGRLGQRVAGGHRHIADPHQGVRAGGVDAQQLVALRALDGEVQLHALGAADPVFLHRLDLLRPAVQLVQVVEQFVGVVGDFNKPLGDVLLLHRGVAAPAAAFDDLLVGEHGLVVGAPVDGGLLAVHQAFFEQLGEEPLFPAVVLRRAGGQLPVPVVAETQTLKLAAHVVDVLVGPGRRRGVVLDRRVFRRQTEGVPAHGLQHVLAQHPLIAADHVADGVVAHMAHVQPAGRVGEHAQAIEGLFTGLLGDLKAAGVFPVLLGFLFYLVGAILCVHRLS